MSTCSRLTTTLDGQMLQGKISGEWVTDTSLKEKTGGEVSEELGGRYLLRYLRDDQKGSFFAGESRPQFLTPSPYAPEEASIWLALFFPWIVRRYVILVDPKQVGRPIRGPRAIFGGFGVEYLMPEGFPAEAVVHPGNLEIT